MSFAANITNQYGLLARQVWDKDFNKADDPIARTTVTLGAGLEGTMSLSVPGVDGNDDVKMIRFKKVDS